MMSRQQKEVSLISIDRRMKQIADVIVLLWSLHLPDSHDFHQWLQHTTQSEREFFKSRLCNFDTRTFYDLGYDIHKIIQQEGYKSKLLVIPEDCFDRAIISMTGKL
jgi:hypothetical protein